MLRGFRRKAEAGYKKAKCLFRSSIAILVFCEFQHLLLIASLQISIAPIVTMSGCGNSNCSCGSSCSCGSGCSCRTMAEPTFGGLRNYNAENDCKCGPNCNCADCQCHK